MRHILKMTFVLSVLLQASAWAQLPAPDSGGAVVQLPAVQAYKALPLSPRGLDFRLQRWVRAQYLRYQRAYQAYLEIQAEPSTPRQAARLTAAYNLQFLLYRSLESLGGNGHAHSGSVALRLLQAEPRTQEKWLELLRVSSEYLDASGWLIWEYQLETGQTRLSPMLDTTDLRIGALPLFVIDHNEYSWKPFFESREAYLEALIRSLNWDQIERFVP